jgi:hypothetical protein
MVSDSLSLPLQEARNSHDCDTKGPSVGFVPDPSTGSIPLDAPGKGGEGATIFCIFTPTATSIVPLSRHYIQQVELCHAARTGAVWWSIDNGGMDQ